MIMGILRTLSYGQRMQISEGNIAIPLNRDDIETWVTRSEERNAAKGKIKPKAVEEIKPVEDTEMSTPVLEQTSDCHPPKEHGYFCFTPKAIPQCSKFLSFNSCCCEDGTAGLLEALYQFALARKSGNPGILSVTKRYSPNSACSTLQIDYVLTGNANATLDDIKAIALYYLTLLGY